MSTPPTAPAMPPKPTTDPTTCRGNMSDAVIKMFADQQYACPQVRGPGSEDDRHNGQRANQHGGLACPIAGPAALCAETKDGAGRACTIAATLHMNTAKGKASARP